MRKEKPRSLKPSSTDFHGFSRKRNLITSSCLFVWFAVCLFVFSSCSDDLFFTDEQGSLSIFIDEISSSRTILPQNTDWSGFTGEFRIEISGLAPILRTINDLSAPIQLDAGNYTVIVTALRNGNNPIARGQTNITVNAGEPLAHIIRLSAIMEAGTGTFNWNVTIPGASAGQLRITQTNGTPVGATVNLSQGANTGTRNLDSGYYFATTTLSRTNHADIVRRDVLHIYQNMTSVFTVEFTDAMFNNNLHNVIFNHGYGGLSDSIPVIHGDKVMRPSAPTRAGYVFMDWYTDAALTALYDFDTPVSNDVTLYARWGTVSVTSGGVTTSYTDLSAALNSITAAGDYTVIVYSDQTHGARTLNTAGANITLVSDGSGSADERIIQFIGETNDHMFYLGSATANLSLGNNITLSGRNGSSANLLVVQSGTLTMLDGSKITGHTTSLSTGAVSVGASANFIMSGGSITGNASTDTAIANSTGALRTAANASVTITGGSITGNFANGLPFDIHAFSDINLSGNAQIGVLRLNLQNANDYKSTVILNTPFTGAVNALHLRSEDTNTDTVISRWVGKQVIQASAVYTLTAADIAKFPLGNFYSAMAGVPQLITDTHILGTEVADLGRLIAIGTAENPFLIYNETDLRAVGNGIYKNANWSLSAHYRLMNNITLTGGNWTAIGTDASRFTGSFDGNFKTVSNLTIATDLVNQGMFGAIDVGGIVRNIGLINVNISGGNATGGIVGRSYGTVENSFVTGTVSHANVSAVPVSNESGGQTGGIVGFGNSGSTVKSSYFSGSVTGRQRVGGIVGSNAGIIQNCYALGSVTGHRRVGGIVGYHGNATGTTAANINSRMVENSYAANTVRGTGDPSATSVGGITGVNQNATVRNSIAINESVSCDIDPAGLFGRLTASPASTTAVHVNNRAWINMSAIANGVPKTIVSDLDDMDGLSVTTNELKAQAAWTSANFAFGTSDAAPWVWENGKMPRLYWETSGARDWPSYLVEPVTVTSGATTTPYASLEAAFNDIGTQAGNFTVTLYRDQTLGAQTMYTANQNITLVSSETGAANERTVQFNGAANARMFMIQNGASLTLGNNITLVGINNSTMQLLYVQNGTLTMNNGSKVTGHTTSMDVVVVEGANSRFTMNGGTITGNSTTWAGGSDLSGGLLINSGAAATITGGSITGNSPVDLFVNSPSSLNLSGNAAIGNIRLNATSAIANANASITLGAFTGTVGTLHLRGQVTDMNNAISYWENRQVIQAAASYTLTAADMAKFPLGNFYSAAAGSPQAISLTHRIGTTGTDLGRLIKSVYNIGDTGPAGGIIIYHDPAGFTVQGYTGATGSFAAYTAYYLEAAPTNQSTSVTWSNTDILIPNLSQDSSDTIDQAIGRGRLNTALIAAAHPAGTIDNNAAKAAAAYSGGGKNDWFLPSREELNLIYLQRSQFGIATGLFWSSSQQTIGGAWNQNFEYGNQIGFNKNFSYNVRAIRAF